MKFLLLALLSCICSANDRHSRHARQWLDRKIDGVLRIEEIGGSRHVVGPISREDRKLGYQAEPRHPIRHRRRQFRSMEPSDVWPVKKEAVVEGDLVLGGLMMVHEREDTVTCGPVMPQGGVQALEAMLYTLDILNERGIVPGVKIGYSRRRNISWILHGGR